VNKSPVVDKTSVNRLWPNHCHLLTCEVNAKLDHKKDSRTTFSFLPLKSK